MNSRQSTMQCAWVAGRVAGRFRRVTTLDTAMDDLVVAAVLKRCPDLTTVRLRYHFMTDAIVLAAAQLCPLLHTVALEGPFISEIGLTQLVTHCTRLRSLSLTRLSSIYPPALEAVGKHCPQLTSFEMVHCGRNNGYSLLPCSATIIKGCRDLSELRLEGLCITSAVVTAITSHRPRLTLLHVNLAYNSTAQFDFAAVARSCPLLRSVSFVASVGINADEIVAALAQNCPFLSDLAVAYFGDMTAESFKALGRHSHRLERLSVRCNPPSDEGLVDLTAGCSGLRQISLSRCEHLTDVSATALACCHNLREIYCSSWPLTDSGAVEIAAHCPHLKSVCFHTEHLTVRGATAFRKHCDGLRDKPLWGL
eukprot:m.477771 g.477771  ORF g.477771 m.477771 type:complete len:366 (-) comp44959_c0_seq1:82-1179(-)